MFVKDNMEVDVPQYILSEAEEYLKCKEIGNDKYMKLENIKALVGLAVLNNRMSRKEGIYFINSL